MANRGTEALFSIADQAVGKFGETIINLGQWVVPVCYRLKCEQIIGHAKLNEGAEERTARLVNGLSQIALDAAHGLYDGIDSEQVAELVRVVSPTLDGGVDYHDVIPNPHVAIVCDKLAPLYK